MDVATPPRAVPAGLLDREHRPLTIGAVALVSLAAFEALAVTTAMPAVAASLGGTALYGLAAAAPLAGTVVGLVAGGSWADRAGPARPLRTGVALFVAGLLVAGLAPAMGVVAAGRAVQGVGGGLLSVSLYALVGRAYPAALHAPFFAALSAAWVVPALVGPAIAGLLTGGLGWRAVFLAVPLVAVPAALLLAPALRALPAPDPEPLARNPRRGGGMAPTAGVGWAVLTAAGAAALHVGGQHRGGPLWAVMAIGLVAVAVALPRLLPRGTWRAARGLPAVVALRGAAAGAFGATEVFVPLLLQRERGWGPAAAGLALTLGAIAWSAGSAAVGRGRAGGPSRRLAVGMGAITAGIAAAALVTVAAVPAWVLPLGWAAGGLGMGLVYPTLSVLTLQHADADHGGRAAAALQVADAVGITLALALGGALFAVLLASGVVAYQAVFAASAVLALAGMALARRAA